jgi:hypothetical protein
MPAALSLHAIKRFLEKFEIRSVAALFARRLNPFLLQRVFGWAIVLVKNPKYSRERELGEFVGGELVGDVVAQLVLGRVVPFLFLNHFEAAAFLRVGRIEHVRKEFDAFAKAFDDGEALVIESALDHFHHVFDLRGVRARDERSPAGDEFFHRIDRLIDRAGRVGFTLEPDRRRRRGLLFGQAIDEVVHDEIGHVDVLARSVIDMVAAYRETVAVATEEEDVQVGPGQADAGGQRDGAAVNVVRAVAVDEIGKARRTTDPREGDDLLVIEVAFLEDFVERGEHREIAAARTPGRVIGGNGFFGEFFPWRFGRRRCGCGCFAHKI